MARFIDVHSGMKGISAEEFAEAHRKDQALEAEEGVHFIRAWADPETGHAFCLSEGPSKDAVQRVHQKAGHPADAVHEVPLVAE